MFKTKAEELRHEIRVHYCNLASCPICSKKWQPNTFVCFVGLKPKGTLSIMVKAVIWIALVVMVDSISI